MAKAIFDYHGHHIEFAGPTFQPLWSGLKYYYSPWDRELHKIAEVLELDKMETFVDVGACIGALSMVFSQISPDAVVYAYEPAAVNYEFLVQNMKAYPNVRCLKKVVSSSNGQTEIALHPREEYQRQHWHYIGLWKIEYLS
jgi:hypothetical protein